MSWLFSQALVEEFLPASLSDGEPSAQWNVMPTQRGFWRNDKTMAFSRLSQFGPTLKLLTEDPGEAVLTSYLAAFPARTYQLPEPVKESMESEVGCGEKWHASFAKYDRDSSSWKTHQHSLLGGLDEFSETWPRWGSMRNGECWERPTLGLPTSESESGLLPTPLATDWKGGRSQEAGENVGRGPKNSYQDFCRQVLGWKRPHPVATEELMGWPTQWTELKPLEMDKSQSVQQQHFKNWLNDFQITKNEAEEA